MQDIQTRDVRTVALKNCQNLGGRFYLIKFHFRNIFFFLKKCILKMYPNLRKIGDFFIKNNEFDTL